MKGYSLVTFARVVQHFVEGAPHQSRLRDIVDPVVQDALRRNSEQDERQEGELPERRDVFCQKYKSSRRQLARTFPT